MDEVGACGTGNRNPRPQAARRREGSVAAPSRPGICSDGSGRSGLAERAAARRVPAAAAGSHLRDGPDVAELHELRRGVGFLLVLHDVLLKNQLLRGRPAQTCANRKLSPTTALSLTSSRSASREGDAKANVSLLFIDRRSLFKSRGRCVDPLPTHSPTNARGRRVVCTGQSSTRAGLRSVHEYPMCRVSRAHTHCQK
jgi:hypothetical protein